MTPDFRSLVDVLRFRAAAPGDTRAYSFLVDGEIGVVTWSYAELDERARAVAAARLAESVPASQPALVRLVGPREWAVPPPAAAAERVEPAVVSRAGVGVRRDRVSVGQCTSGGRRASAGLRRVLGRDRGSVG